MTAINKPSASKFRPLSGKIEKNSNQQLLELDDIADDEDYVIDELIEDSDEEEPDQEEEFVRLKDSKIVDFLEPEEEVSFLE